MVGNCTLPPLPPSFFKEEKSIELPIGRISAGNTESFTCISFSGGHGLFQRAGTRNCIKCHIYKHNAYKTNAQNRWLHGPYLQRLRTQGSALSSPFPAVPKPATDYFPVPPSDDHPRSASRPFGTAPAPSSIAARPPVRSRPRTAAAAEPRGAPHTDSTAAASGDPRLSSPTWLSPGQGGGSPGTAGRTERRARAFSRPAVGAERSGAAALAAPAAGSARCPPGARAAAASPGEEQRKSGARRRCRDGRAYAKFV